MDRALGRMNTSVERNFVRTPEGAYREVWLHFINFLDESGNIRSQKLDKRVYGKLWRVAKDGERSMYGEVTTSVPESDRPVRLICLGNTR